MSRHEGVSCDSCLKGNFRGRRYKCLICYDYDLCATCYESGATTTRHTSDHPMQCILTRADFDLYYGGEALTAEQPQAFTCPFCGKMGYTETTLQEHVTADHTDTSSEVVCPICAALPGGDPNHVTDDFAAHLTLEHRSPRDFDEPAGLRHVRRIPHPSRGVGATRNRRTNMHFSSAGSTLTGLSPSELLSQLSSVRSRAAAAQSVSSQLQQLEMQLQSTRQQLERLPRRSADSTAASGRGVVMASGPSIAADPSSSTSSNNNNVPSSQFLLPRCTEISSADGGIQGVETEKVDRGLFVQELLLSTLTEHLQLGDLSEWITSFGNSSSDTETQASSTPTVSETNPSLSQQTSQNSLEPVESKRSLRGASTGDTSHGVKRKASSTTMTVTAVGISSGLVQPASTHAQVLVPGPAVRAPLSPNQGVLQGPIAGVAVGASPQPHVRPSPTGIRDPRMNPTASKRNLLKHVEATKKSEPPPH